MEKINKTKKLVVKKPVKAVKAHTKVSKKANSENTSKAETTGLSVYKGMLPATQGTYQIFAGGSCEKQDGRTKSYFAENTLSLEKAGWPIKRIKEELPQNSVYFEKLGWFKLNKVTPHIVSRLLAYVIVCYTYKLTTGGEVFFWNCSWFKAGVEAPAMYLPHLWREEKWITTSSSGEKIVNHIHRYILNTRYISLDGGVSYGKEFVVNSDGILYLTAFTTSLSDTSLDNVISDLKYAVYEKQFAPFVFKNKDGKPLNKFVTYILNSILKYIKVNYDKETKKECACSNNASSSVPL